MRIIQTIYSLASGGAERLVVDLSNELAARGNEVILCTLRDDSQKEYSFYKESVSSSVNYMNYRCRKGFNYSICILYYKLIKKYKPDIVHCHLGTLYYLLPLVFLFRKVKFFYTLHNLATEEVERKIELKIRSFFFRKKGIQAITISSQVSESFRRIYGSDYFIQIENGRKKEEASSSFNQVSDEIRSYRENNKTVCLHVARCSYQKNQMMLIDTFNQLIEAGFPVVLLIIGREFDSDRGRELKKRSGPGIYYLGEKKYCRLLYEFGYILFVFHL